MQNHSIRLKKTHLYDSKANFMFFRPAIEEVFHWLLGVVYVDLLKNFLFKFCRFARQILAFTTHILMDVVISMRSFFCLHYKSGLRFARSVSDQICLQEWQNWNKRPLHHYTFWWEIVKIKCTKTKWTSRHANPVRSKPFQSSLIWKRTFELCAKKHVF